MDIFQSAVASVGGGDVMTNQAQRDISKKPDSLPASEWDYRTIKEFVEASPARQISASDLLEHVIARIEALDRGHKSSDLILRIAR